MLRGCLSGPVQPVEIPIPMTATTAVVHVSNVRLEYGGRAVLRGINLSVAKGSMTAVLGPSGSGKSTLLSAITGELVPAQGQVEVFGQPVPRDARGLLAMRKRLGVLLQGNGLLTDLTVLENVALPLHAHSGLPAAEIQARALAKLEAVGLAAAADRFPRELSGGMARRAALARALALDPPLLLCDEPLTGLDPIASGVVMSLLRQLNQSLGLTCIVVSHHVRETLPVCDQAVVVANGGLVFDGTPEALQASQDPLLRQFLDGSPHGPIAFDDVTGQRAA
jgi:phospholipid/cholesterol/gamma-HCH transport system ATP-binding protein